MPSPLPEDFTRELARVAPRLGRLGRRVHYEPSVGSTNDVVSAAAAAGEPEGLVVCADEQTAGRGRLGRTWHSPPGSGLYVSVLLTPALYATDPLRSITLVTLAAGVALSQAVEHQTGFRPDIKWPNDLLIGRRKLAGILAEGVGPGLPRVVLGYGINVGPMVYPPDLAERATSLANELGRHVDRTGLWAESLACLAERYADLLAGRFDAILDAWRERAPSSRGAAVRWQTPDGEREGTTAGIDESGALLVQSRGTVQRIVSGEVSLSYAAGH